MDTTLLIALGIALMFFTYFLGKAQAYKEVEGQLDDFHKDAQSLVKDCATQVVELQKKFDKDLAQVQQEVETLCKGYEQREQSLRDQLEATERLLKSVRRPG